MRRIPILSSFVCLAIASAACTGPSRSSDRADAPLDFALTFQEVDVPAPPGSGYPQLTSSPRGATLSWIELDGPTAALKFAERTPDGWSDVRTAATGDDWFITSADVPSVLRMSDGTLVANWYPTVDPLIEAYDMRLSFSKDEGRTWAPAFAPHHDGTKTQHGFATLFELPGRGVGLVWLDGRDRELNTADPLGGSMALYFAAFDTTWKQTAETAVNMRVCECCQTSAVAVGMEVLVAFRDRSSEEVRDIHVSRLQNGTWTAAQPLHSDNWTIDACPINGPALSARDSLVAAAWFTAPNDEGRAFAAFSQDGGRTWGSPIRLDEVASLGHVDVELLDDGSALASWVESAGGRSQFKVRRVAASGARSESMNVPGAGRVSGYPRMARAGEDVLLAWAESDGDRRLKGALAR